MSSDPAAPEREGREHIPLHIRITHQTKVLNMPTPTAPVAGTAQWMFYGSGVYGPANERTIRQFTERYGQYMSDESGVANMVFAQMWAEIDRLRAEVNPVRCPCCEGYRDRGDAHG